MSRKSMRITKLNRKVELIIEKCIAYRDITFLQTIYIGMTTILWNNRKMEN
jgi:hypothetical protein